MAKSVVSNDELKEIRDTLTQNNPDLKITSQHIQAEIKQRKGVEIDVSTIRGRFCSFGEPLGGTVSIPGKTNAQPASVEETLAKPEVVKDHTYDVPDHLKHYIPEPALFDNYIERGIDKRLALHYDNGKHPITQGKQGTGKTFSHEHYAYKRQLPFFLYSCHEDFKLNKLFGDKTIENGSVVFKENLFVQALQNPSVVLFDEVNAINNKESFPFHALLQNRELFVKDADNGNGKVYRLHKECRIGFAQNPKSAKYLGGNVKRSNFLGRCTFITYPEFTKIDIRKAIAKKFNLSSDEIMKFTTFYFNCIKALDQAQIPVDISIRQLNSVIELYLAGLPLREAIEDGMSSIMEAASQPQNKEVFWRIAQATWKELMDEKQCDSISKSKGFASILNVWRIF
jgi:MoxR-like ATPase